MNINNKKNAKQTKPTLGKHMYLEFKYSIRLFVVN